MLHLYLLWMKPALYLGGFSDSAPFGKDSNNSYCFTDINACDGAMCLNGATCEDGINSYNCLCRTGFTGNLCETGR